MAHHTDQGLGFSFARQSHISFEVVEKKDRLGVQSLIQVHSNRGVEVDSRTQEKFEADFLWTYDSECSIGIFVADCTAILCEGMTEEGRFFRAGIHAGWRGTASGIIGNAMREIRPRNFEAWLSPSICTQHFEVGEEVRLAFKKLDAEMFFFQSRPAHYYFDLKGFQVREMLKWSPRLRISSLCTYCQNDFVSYRKARGNLNLRHLALLAPSSFDVRI